MCSVDVSISLSNRYVGWLCSAAATQWLQRDHILPCCKRCRKRGKGRVRSHYKQICLWSWSSWVCQRSACAVTLACKCNYSGRTLWLKSTLLNLDTKTSHFQALDTSLSRTPRVSVGSTVVHDTLSVLPLSQYMTNWQTSSLTSTGQEGADNWIFHMPLSWSTMFCTGEFFLCSVATIKHTCTKVLLLYVLWKM